MRRLTAALVLLAGCREGLVEERRAEVVELCASFCPQRVACVDDGYAGGSVEECERKCNEDDRPLEQGACGEASLDALMCLAGVACEDLAAAVSGVTSPGDAACYAELRAQQDACDLTPIY